MVFKFAICLCNNFSGVKMKICKFIEVLWHTHACMCSLYEKEEYKALVLECYWQSKTNVKHSNYRYIYKCIHCEQQFFDKNNILYNWLMNLYKFWNGHGTLKMYLTLTRLNNSKLKKITLKFGKDMNTSVKSTVTSDNDRPKKTKKSGEGGPT